MGKIQVVIDDIELESKIASDGAEIKLIEQRCKTANGRWVQYVVLWSIRCEVVARAKVSGKMHAQTIFSYSDWPETRAAWAIKENEGS